MTYRLFLDDERDPPRDGTTWVVVRNFDDATKVVTERGLPAFISFDHDLGITPDGNVARTGADFARWLGDFVIDTNDSLEDFKWYVHSQNPIGAENINGYLESLVQWMRREHP